MMVEESLHKYTLALYERVTPGDLEQDLYDTIKKTGAGTIAGTIAGVGAMSKYAHRKYIEKHVLPKMMVKYANKLKKDIDQWHDKYDNEFMVLTNDAIARAKLAIPDKSKANSPEGIQTYNTHMKSIAQAYKNMYLRYLEGLHGLLRREYAVMTKHIVKIIEKEGWGSISDKARATLTDRWDKIIRDENTNSYNRMKTTLDDAEAKLNDQLGPNNALGLVLHERPTAFFSSDDYTKISSFLNKTIEDIKSKEVAFDEKKKDEEKPLNTDEESALKILKYANNKYKYLTSNDIPTNDIYDESKLALEKLRSIKGEALSSAYQKKYTELIVNLKKLISENEPQGGNLIPTTDDEKYINFAESKLEELLNSNSLSNEDLLEELNKVQVKLKNIKEEKLDRKFRAKLSEITSKISDNVKSLKTGKIEDVVSINMEGMYENLKKKKNSSLSLLPYNKNDFYEFAHDFAVKLLENPTALESVYKKIKSEKVDTTKEFNYIMETYGHKFYKNILNAIKKIYTRLKNEGVLTKNMSNYEFKVFSESFANALIHEKNKYVKEYNELINDVVKNSPDFASITPDKFMFLTKKYIK